MADRVPDELLVDILRRLTTIEDLVRCASVCKFWYSLITCPNFISFHMKQRITPNPSLVLVQDYYDRNPHHEQYSIRFENDPFELYQVLDFPLKTDNPNPGFRVVGCLNGVVCLVDDRRGNTVLWNPSIRKVVTLPKPLITYPYMVAVGFGFNAVTNDFKVIRAAHLKDDSFKAEVYSLSLGSWRIAKPKKFPYVTDDRSSQAFLNGSVHWVGRTVKSQRNDKFRRVVVLLDVADEVFSMLSLPSCVEDSISPIQLSVLEESLSFSHYFGSADGYKSSIWVMKQYGLPDSWTKLFTIDIAVGSLRPFGLRKSGEALSSSQMMFYSKTMLVSFTVKSKQVQCLRVFYGYKRLCVENFQETLALLGVKGDTHCKPSPTIKFLQRMLKIHLKEKIQLSSRRKSSLRYGCC